MIQTALKKVAKGGYSKIYHLRLELSGVCTVSYTHLDVYKRQRLILVVTYNFFFKFIKWLNSSALALE